MPDNETKRIRRTPEQRASAVDNKIEKANEMVAALEAKKAASIAECDAKIAALQEKIAGYQKQKEEILKPKPPKKPRKTKKQKMADILKAAQKSGMKPEEIAEKLGVELSE